MFEMTKDINKLNLLKSLGINYPVIRDLCCEPEKLFIVIINAGQMRVAIELLSSKDTPKLSTIMNYKQIQKILTNYNSAYVVYPYVPSPKGKDLLYTLSSIIRTGDINGIPITALPIVISEGVPQDIDLQDFFIIYTGGNLNIASLEVMDFVPDDDQLPVVIDKMQHSIGHSTTPEEKSFLAAACFLYPTLMKIGYPEKLSNLLDDAKTMIIENDENQDCNNIKEIFVQELYCWQEESKYYDVFELPYLETYATRNMEHVILYDENYIYMKDSVFKAIAHNLLQVFSLETLKKTLIEEGVLCPNKSKSYTVKVGFYNVAGEFQRERMLRFDRQILHKIGEVEFIEICIGEGEKDD